MGSIDWVLQEASAALGPLLSAIGAATPLEVALFATGLVATPRFLATMALGPLVPPGSHFLELLVNIHAWSFITLRLPEAIRRVLSAPGLAIGEVALVEQSRPELVWPVDVILGTGDSAVLYGR
jgi:hypothetical protein